MTIFVTCECGKTYQLSDDKAGKRAKCQKCGNPLQIPSAGDDSDAPVSSTSDSSGSQESLSPDGQVEAAIGHVNAFLRECDLEPDNCLSSDDDVGLTWSLRKGSASIIIIIIRSDDDPFVTVLSRIVTLPTVVQMVEPCLRYCMEHNRFLRTSLCLNEDDEINVRVSRSLKGLDKDEIDDLILDVAHVADKYDNRLVSKFGCEMLGEQ